MGFSKCTHTEAKICTGWSHPLLYAYSTICYESNYALMTYADSEGLDQHVHLSSLIRALAVHLQIYCILQNTQIYSKGPHQIEWPLRKHDFSNILKILSQIKKKNENFQIKNSDIFLISAQKHRLWVLIRTASMRVYEAVLMSTHNLCFWAEIRKIMYTPVKPCFTT